MQQSGMTAGSWYPRRLHRKVEGSCRAQKTAAPELLLGLVGPGRALAVERLQHPVDVAEETADRAEVERRRRRLAVGARLQQPRQLLLAHAFGAVAEPFEHGRRLQM